MWNRAERRAALLALGLAAWVPAHADPYHQINLLVGDRAAGMAGAYVAVSDDPSGLYYNPAGIAYARHGNLSASMNTYNRSERRYRAVLGGKDWVRRSASLLPNYFGVTQPLGPGVAGFSYAVPDSVLEDQDQVIPDVPTTLSSEAATYTINFNNQDNTYLAGPSYALPLGPRAALGLTLYGYQRSRQLILNQQFSFSDPSLYHWENTYVQQEEYGLRPILGLMLSPWDKISLGLTLARTFVLKADEFSQRSCAGMTGFSGYASDGLCQPGALHLERIRQSITPTHPWTLTLGGAYFPSPALLLSSQLNLYQNPNGGTRPLWNASAGGEYYFTPRLAVRAGLFSDNATTPHLRPDATDQPEHIDYLGASLSLTHFTRNSALTLGASARRGKGQAQILGGQSAIQTVEAVALTLYLSASYSY